MDFFGIGFGELLLILLLVLIIWGPRRLPEIARTLGKTVRTLRKASNDLTSAVTREIEAPAPPQPKQNPAAKNEKTPPDADSNKPQQQGDQSRNS